LDEVINFFKEFIIFGNSNDAIKLSSFLNIIVWMK